MLSAVNLGKQFGPRSRTDRMMVWSGFKCSIHPDSVPERIFFKIVNFDKNYEKHGKLPSMQRVKVCYQHMQSSNMTPWAGLYILYDYKMIHDMRFPTMLLLLLLLLCMCLMSHQQLRSYADRPQLKISSDRLVKQGMEPANPGLQDKRFIHYTTAAPFPTMWYVRSAMAQTSLHIHAD